MIGVKSGLICFKKNVKIIFNDKQNKKIFFKDYSHILIRHLLIRLLS